MSHVRQQIRDAIKDALTGLSTTGDNVFKSRIYPLEETGLPGITISSGDDELVDVLINSYPRLHRRQATITVRAYAKNKSNVDDDLDNICSEVETALSADLTLGGLSKDIFLSSTSIEFEQGESPHGMAEMSWLVSYVIEENAPNVSK